MPHPHGKLAWKSQLARNGHARARHSRRPRPLGHARSPRVDQSGIHIRDTTNCGECGGRCFRCVKSDLDVQVRGIVVERYISWRRANLGRSAALRPRTEEKRDTGLAPDQTGKPSRDSGQTAESIGSSIQPRARDSAVIPSESARDMHPAAPTVYDMGPGACLPLP